MQLSHFEVRAALLARDGENGQPGVGALEVHPTCRPVQALAGRRLTPTDLSAGRARSTTKEDFAVKTGRRTLERASESSFDMVSKPSGRGLRTPCLGINERCASSPSIMLQGRTMTPAQVKDLLSRKSVVSAIMRENVRSTFRP